MRVTARDWAIRILALAASGPGGETLAQIAEALGRAPGEPGVALARRMLCRSLNAGTWREQRAEAEARLRCER